MSNEEPEATPIETASGDVPVSQPPASSEPASEARSSSKLSTAIILLTTVLAVVSVFSVWARTQLLDTDEWVNLSTELVDQPEVQDAVATYLVEQVYADGNVTEGLEEVLPEDLSGLAGPLAGVIRGPLTDSVAVLLSSDQFQQLWEATNRVAHETLVSVLRGEDVAGLATEDGEVALELRELVLAAGETIGLPQERLDEIPADAARIVIFESEELDSVQQVVEVFEWLAWFLFVLVVALYAIAVFLAPGRRLTALRNVGLSLVAVGVIVLAARAIAVRTLVDAIVEDPTGRPTADSVLTVGTSLLRQQGWSAVIYGLLFVGFATLLGNRRWATATRHFVAPVFNASTGAVVGGTAVAVLLLLWWSPGRAFNGWTTGLVLIALVIGAVVTMRAQTLREFPDASIDEVEDDLAGST
ncbi:hypothetical protein [Ilumatobacter sp.]|uniref:hypothetical protein n=1 Tax=Ilumatobacter sp. TaxID=1967498 RepID=UPI003AF69A1E